MADLTENYVGVHWLSGSFPAYRVSEVRRIIGREQCGLHGVFAGESWQTAGGLNGYQISWTLGDGDVVILADTDSEFSKRVHNDKATVIFRGGFFDRLGGERIPEFGRWVKTLDITPGRVDLYYQDVSRSVEPFDLLGLWKRGSCRGFQTRRYIESESKRGTASTIEFGRRGSSGSGKFLRVYDKEAESGGEVLGIRWELEFSGKRAAASWEILERSDWSVKTIAGMVFAASDWVEPTDDQHRRRWRRLGWYQAFLDGSEQISVRVPVEPTCIGKKDAWLLRSVAGTLAYVRCFLQCVDGCEDGWWGRVDQYEREGRKMVRGPVLRQLLRDIEKYRDRSLDPLSESDVLHYFEDAA